MKLGRVLVVSAALLGFGMAGASASTTVVVNGTSNPFLAGASGGESVTMNGFTDTFADDAPVGIAITGGEVFNVSNVAGLVSNGPCCLAVGPTGGGGTPSFPVTANGFTELVAGYASLPINSLIGVFYGPNPADPGVDTVFEIGNGGSFVAPAGTTELFLATVDGYQWSNNSGDFRVTYTIDGTPEPATWIALLVGFGMLGFAVRASRGRAAATMA
jgi:hypothetical protein